MSKKRKIANDIYDFSTGWEDVKPLLWEWIMWNEKGEQVIGWIVAIRDEEFTDKNTGEVRTNPVCYMITPEKEAIRFIVPTDLRFKLEALKHLLDKEKLGYSDVVVLIGYEGMEKTASGYSLKRFTLKRKKVSIPEDVKEAIPPFPENGHQDDVEFEF